MRNPRPVKKLVTSHRQREGGGFVVRRPFPTQGFDHADPFLLLDEMGPVDYEPGEAVGAPDHPHRGFETVSYILEGEMQHEDSAGNAGKLESGDVQWMTAGAGVVHSEMPSTRMREEGGRVHGFQVWVNLPAKDKMIAPRYQEIPAAKIPSATSEDGKARVKVVAGEALGVSAVIDTHTPIIYQHWELDPGADVEQVVPEDHAAYAYVFGGAVQLGPDGERAEDGQLATFGPGDTVRLAVPADARSGARLLLLAGVPLREPVARHGPFVMNTRQELVQAMMDYEAGRMGQIER